MSRKLKTVRDERACIRKRRFSSVESGMMGKIASTRQIPFLSRTRMGKMSLLRKSVDTNRPKIQASPGPTLTSGVTCNQSVGGPLLGKDGLQPQTHYVMLAKLWGGECGEMELPSPARPLCFPSFRHRYGLSCKNYSLQRSCLPPYSDIAATKSPWLSSSACLSETGLWGRIQKATDFRAD